MYRKVTRIRRMSLPLPLTWVPVYGATSPSTGKVKSRVNGKGNVKGNAKGRCSGSGRFNGNSNCRCAGNGNYNGTIAALGFDAMDVADCGSGLHAEQ